MTAKFVAPEIEFECWFVFASKRHSPLPGIIPQDSAIYDDIEKIDKQ